MNARAVQWGKYELIERLGRGGMGEVWKARITGVAGFSRTLVVKRLLPHLLDDKRFIQMFLTEARLSAQLEHPNIVQIFELSDVNGEFFLAMEYVHGRDLGRVIAQLAMNGARPPVAMSVYVTREVCRALSYAHQLTDRHGARLGLIHRDVSPSNVMLALSGAVKLLDFGVAKAATESYNPATQTGVLKGKLWYMAPERVEGRNFDHRSDIFSTGVVLYEALTATRLFEAQNPAKVISLIVNKPIEPPSRINPAVAPELDAIVMRALSRDPDARYATADLMANELDELLFRMRFGAEQMSRFLQDTFSLGTHVEADALEFSDTERKIDEASTQAAKRRASLDPEQSATVVAAPSAETTARQSREESGTIEGDRTTMTINPPLMSAPTSNAVEPVDDDAGTHQLPLPPHQLPTEMSPALPSDVSGARTTAFRRWQRWRWPLALAVGAVAAAGTTAVGFVMSSARGRPAVAAPDENVIVTITSDPPEADAVVEGANVIGQTPLTARVHRGERYRLRVTRSGYAPYTTELPADGNLRLHVVLKPLR